jgi:hypothetical protein
MRLWDSVDTQRKDRPFAKEMMFFAVGAVSGFLESFCVYRITKADNEEEYEVQYRKKNLVLQTAGEDQLGYIAESEHTEYDEQY